MDHSVVIVNWNAGDALSACVGSVEAEPGVRREIILVDNASTDGSVAAACGGRPAVRVVETGGNLGFGAGANAGAAVARGDVLVFLNPDARVVPGAIGCLLETLRNTPGAGIAGGGLVDERGRWQPGAARFTPLRHLLLDTTLGRLPERVRRAPRRVDWVYGTFMAVRRDVFTQLGGFDRRYFLYGEDLDLCHRAAQVGVRTVHVPAARVVHAGALSAGARFGNGRDAEVVKGEMRFYAARGGPGALRRFRVAAAGKFGLKATLAAIAGRRDAAARYAHVVRACVAFDPR